MPNDGMVSMLDRWEQQGNPFAVTPRKKKTTENDGGSGSGNFNHGGRPGKVGGSTSGDKKASDTNHKIVSISNPDSDSVKRAFASYDPFEIIDKYDPLLSQAEKDGDTEKLRKLRKQENDENQENLGKRLKSLGTYMEPGYYINAKDADNNRAEMFLRGTVNTQVGCYNMQPATSGNGRDSIAASYLTDSWIRISESEVKQRILDESIKRNDDVTLDGVSNAEERAIKTYTYASAASSALRNGKTSEQSNAIQSVMDRTASPERTVYRGVSSDYARKLSALKVGDTTSDKGFASTSYEKDVAQKFAGDDGIVMKIHVPSGFGHSLSVGYLSDKHDEYEVLLNRNVQLKVKEKDASTITFEASWPSNNSDGGSGSGNFGHEGRPGKVGGAAKGERRSNKTATKESGSSKLKSMSDNDFQKSTGYSKKNPDSAKVAYTLADKGFSPKEIKETSNLFDRHSLGYEPQKNADNEISAHIKDEDAIGRLLLDKSEIEEKALRDSGITEFYRKGALDKDVLAFTDDPEGATMPTGENGELEHIGWDVNVSLDDLLAKGYRPIAGGNCADVGSPSEKEILFAKFPDASSYEDLDSIRSKESEAAKEYSKSYKSLIPENSYFNDPSYDNDSKKFTDCNKVIDDSMKIVKDLEKRIATEGVIKPRSEWTEEDEVDAMLGEPPMKYPEKVKGYQMAKDSILTSLNNVEKDRDAANERMQKTKQKAHDEQIKSVSFDKPVKASSDNYEGFTTKTTGTGYDEYINGKQNGGYIAEMSPAEYLKRCAYQVFENATIESTLAAINEKNVDEYAKKMESGEKFDMPYLNLKKGEQEGRHRAAAAMKAGIEKIPVLVVGYKQNTDSADTNGSVGVLVIKDGQILCGIRSGNTAPGCICGPGGHIENGETPEQAATRETQEEFGITPKDLVPIGNGPAESDTGYSPNLFLCTDYEGEPNCTSNEMSWAQFVDLDRFANNPPSMFQPFADSIICLLNAMSLDDHEDGVFFAGELDDHAEGHDKDDNFFE